MKDCGKNPNVKEHAWERGVAERHYLFTKSQLKQWAYGFDRPSLKLETERAVEEARRLAGDVASLLTAFPNGFGSLANDLKKW